MATTILYSSVQVLGFTLYNEDFDYQLTQNVAANPVLMSDNNFFRNKAQLRMLIDSGNNAVERQSDTFAAQQCYEQATDLRVNAAEYFNINS